MGRADRGWAQRLLEWRWEGLRQTAETSRARYVIRGERHEVLAWCEVRDVGGRRRVEIGSFPSVALARAACETDAAARCRRDDADDCPPVSGAISPGRRRAAKADKGRELAAPNYRPAEAGDLDDALAAFADVIEDEG
jgi:hypothetical protein